MKEVRTLGREFVMTIRCTSYGGFGYRFEVPEKNQAARGKGLAALSWHRIWTTGVMLLLLLALFVLL